MWHRKKVEEEEVDPEQLKKDMERLELIKKKRWVTSAQLQAMHWVLVCCKGGHNLD